MERKPDATETETVVLDQPNTQDLPDDGLVDVHEADIESLDAALKNAVAQESGEAEAAPTEEAPATDKPEVTQAAPAAKADTSKPVPATETATAAPSVPATPEEIQAIQAENKRLKEQRDQKELFIQRRSTELGTLRQQLAARTTELQALKLQLENGLEEKFRENPLQASKDQKTLEQIESELEGIKGKGARAQHIVEAQTFFVKNVDTEKVSLEDIADVLKADGVDEQYIAAFKANPWEWTTPEALVQMGKRAEDRKEFATADTDRRTLAKYVLHLKAELEKAQKKPAQVMAQVQRNLNRPAPLTASQSASPKTVRDLDPTRMTNAELDLALKQAMRH